MEQFDLEEFAKMFDAALESDNPTVKKALRNFMMVAAIVHAEDEDGDESVAGPLETLIKKVSYLENVIRELQNNQLYKNNYYKDYYRTEPTWIYSPNTSTTSGTTSWSYPSSADVDLDNETIKKLMKDLKFNDK